jgi:hypothetical protein
MITDATILALGLLLLGVPSPTLCSSEVRGRLQQMARRRDEGLGSLCRCWVNWADLIRGAAGVLLVQRAFATAPGVQDDLAMVHLVAEMGIFGLAVAAQIFWPGRPVRVVGPVFFLTGFTLALSGLTVGLFAVALGFTCSMMVKRLSVLFALVPAGLLAFGMLFHSMGILGLFNAALFVAPGFFAFAFGQRLGFVRRPVEHKAPREDYELVPYGDGVKLEERIVHQDFNSASAPAGSPAQAAVVPDGMMFNYPPESGLRSVSH